MPKDDINPLNLSDDEVGSLDWDQLKPQEEPEDNKEEQAIEETKQEEQTEVNAKENSKSSEETLIEDTASTESGETDTQNNKKFSEEDSGDDKQTEELDPEKDNKNIEEKEESTKLDHTAEYQKLIAPFKANGKMMQIENVEEARKLMQMGANYSKKMAGLKPNLKLLKMLENNDLLNETKLSYLIDLDKKDPGAIKKLVQDSKLDVSDLDPEDKVDYVPKTPIVTDKEVELQETLDTFRDTKTFDTTINIVSKEWDEASQLMIQENLDILPVLNEQVASGIYEQVSSRVERERLVSDKLNGMSDLQAYQYVGDFLFKSGAFTRETPSDTGSSSTKNIDTLGKPNKLKQVDPELKARKKAAGTTKNLGSGGGSNNDYNPLSMPDEEFEKITQKNR